MSTVEKSNSVNGICETINFRRKVPVRRVFHATAIANMESIFSWGQLSRDILIDLNIPFVELYNYGDRAEKEKRDFSYCPYHLFCDTAFDFRIKQNYDNIPFLYITWPFAKPYKENWLLIPNHAAREKKRPLFEFENLNYRVHGESYSLRTHALLFGNRVKPWEIVQTFHVLSHTYRLVYMAEAVGPSYIPITPDCTLIVRGKDVYYKLKKYAKKYKIAAKVLICPEMFEPRYKYQLC